MSRRKKTNEGNQTRFKDTRSRRLRLQIDNARRHDDGNGYEDDRFSDEDFFTSDEESEDSIEAPRSESRSEGLLSKVDDVATETAATATADLAQTRDGRNALADLIEKARGEIRVEYGQRLLNCKARLKEERLEHEQEIGRLERSLAEMKERAAVVPKLRRRLSDRDVVIEELRRHLSSSVSDNKSADNRLGDVRTANRELRTRINELEEQLRVSYFNSERLQIQMQTSKQMKEYLAEQWELTEKKLEGLGETLRKKNTEIDDLRLKIRRERLFKTFMKRQLAIASNEVGIKLLVKEEMKKLFRRAEDFQMREPLETARRARPL